MDLSKAFNKERETVFLLLAKLKVYGLENNSVTFMRSYLTNRLQRCKTHTFLENGKRYLLALHKVLF